MIACNLVFHGCSKHIKVQYHFLCEKVLDSLPQPRHQLQDPQKLRELVKRLKNSQEHPQHTLNQFSKLNHQEKKKMNELIQEVGNNVEELIEELDEEESDEESDED